MSELASLLIAALVGFFIGWLVSGIIILGECQKLGGFYVGDKTFSCEVKK